MKFVKLLIIFVLFGSILQSCLKEDELVKAKRASSKEKQVSLPVKKQLEAYNNRDVDAYKENFAQDVELYRLGENTPFCRGLDSMAILYKILFDSKPNLLAKVNSRMICGNVVIDEEYIDGLAEGKQVHAVAIYQIENEKIKKVWFSKKN